MPHYDATSAECFVFIYKDGALSALAHDLKIRVTVFSIDIDDTAGRIDARLNAESLRVECAMRNGVEEYGILDEEDKKEINDHILHDVLETRRYGEIIFTSGSVTREDDSLRISGELLLHGTTRSVAALSRREGAYEIAEVMVRQQDFGIRPFSTLFGALRVKPGILVQVRIPAAGGAKQTAQ